MKKILLTLTMLLASLGAKASTPYTSIKLENGLTAYLIEDHRQPIATHMIWYNVGSGDEVKGKSGLAHLLEHLMFKGTDKIPPQEFSKIIARLGGVDNASTSVDYTNYYQLINTENLPKAMSMEVDRMQNLKLLEKDFQTEREVVTQERHQRIDNSPYGRFYEAIMSTMYTKLPARILTTGTVADLKDLTRQDALDWYNTYYAPNNAILLIVGDLTPTQFIKLVKEKYGSIKPKKVTHQAWEKEPLYSSSKELVLHDRQIKAPIYYKIYRTPSFFSGIAEEPLNKDDIFNLLVLSQLLGGSSTSFLHEELVLNQNIANSVSADFSPVSKAETTLDIYLQVKDGVSQYKAEKALNFALDKFIKEFKDKKQLENIKTSLKASQIYAKDDSMGYARSLGKFLSAGGSIKEFDEFFTKIDAVTLESLKETAKKYLQSEQYLNAWLMPEKD